jgi:hypothetical protein
MVYCLRSITGGGVIVVVDLQHGTFQATFQYCRNSAALLVSIDWQSIPSALYRSNQVSACQCQPALLSSHLKSTPLILNSSRQSHRRGLQSLQQCLRHSTDRHYALGKCHCAVFVACYNSMGRRSHLYVSAIQIDCFTPCLYSSLIDCALRQTVLC